jgi:AcrR family transcriptional regulator
MELFSTRAYDEIWVEEIAERAGVSRGLLYHYFPSKRDYYVAVSRAASEEIRQLTRQDPALPPDDQLRRGLDAFLRFAEEHPHGFLTAHRGSLAGDPEVRAMIVQGRERQASRILRVLTGGGRPPPLLRLAVLGWLALTEDVTAQWLEAPKMPREAVCDLLIRAFNGMVDPRPA